MLETFVLYHQARDARGETEPFSSFAGAAWVFETCLRKIALYPCVEAELTPGLALGAEVFTGAPLVAFLSELACGLHSPMVGETEVFGQFKRSIDQLPVDSPALPLLRLVLSIAKKVRREHLQKLGSQTYGSVSRKLLKKCRTIHVLGAGKLTEELLPWFDGFEEVELFCRTTEKGEALRKVLPKIRIFRLDCDRLDHEPVDEADSDAHLPGELSGLVIAAPMERAELESWVRAHPHPFEIIVDLRGGAEPLERERVAKAQLISLKDVFDSIEGNRLEITEKVDEARRAILGAIDEVLDRVELRPLGWEEICA